MTNDQTSASAVPRAAAPAVTATLVAIDFNCDVGEGFGSWSFGHDATILAHVSSANIACGGHAGDPPTMARTVGMAIDGGVAIGAHVGYPDLAGFGRRTLGIEPQDLVTHLLAQMDALNGCAARSGGAISYVKPHGALYHAGGGHAAAVVDAVMAFDPALPVVAKDGSPLAVEASRRGVTVVEEAFADRRYLHGGSLAPRSQADGVIVDPAAAAAQAVAIATAATTGNTVNGSENGLPRDAATICVHGDSPHAGATARAVRDALDAAGIVVRAFR